MTTLQLPHLNARGIPNTIEHTAPAVDFTVDTGASETDLVFVLPLTSRAQHFARIMFPARGTQWLGTWLFQGRHAEVELRRLERLNYRLRINGAMGGN
jgi:hypothetical protein